MCSFFSKEALDIITDFMTILGVGFAIYVYSRWRGDYKLQKAHEYAIDMLQKLYHLQGLIEGLRIPKFYCPATVEEELKKIFMPKITEMILESITIRRNFTTAKYILLKNKNIMDKYVDLINDKIIKRFSGAIMTFYLEREETELKNTMLWEIIFPAETTQPLKCKTSELGTKEEVIDDEFNRVIENNFNALYELLSKELAI